MIRTIVVDDEKLARDRLLSFLRNITDVEVVGQAKNGAEAVRLIEETSPDLAFLDVQMPGMDGFGVLKAVTKTPQVVFATAFDEYAIKARYMPQISCSSRLPGRGCKRHYGGCASGSRDRPLHRSCRS